MSSIASQIESYAASVKTLRAAVAGMTPDQLRARPIENRWSTLEVVAHIADFEPILVDRMVRVISHERPLLMVADENLINATTHPHQRDLEEELSYIEATRARMSRILSGLSEDVFNRVGIHSFKGLVTLASILTGAINHIDHHVKFIDEKRKALGI